MSTAKERVLAYFEDWAGKVENRNGFSLVNDHGMWNLYYEGLRAWYAFTQHDSHYEIAARILKLDPPQAAPIEWREEHMGFISDCGLYRITKGAMGGVWIDFRHTINVAFSGTCCELFIANPETVESSKSECQAHKQKRFNQLGGYNV